MTTDIEFKYTREQLAELFNRRSCNDPMFDQVQADAAKQDLVYLFGVGANLVEVCGAIDAELDIDYDDEDDFDLFVDATTREVISEYDVPLSEMDATEYEKVMGALMKEHKIVRIKASVVRLREQTKSRRIDEETGDWDFRMEPEDIPCSTFEVINDGGEPTNGIVLDLRELRER